MTLNASVSPSFQDRGLSEKAFPGPLYLKKELRNLICEKALCYFRLFYTHRGAAARKRTNLTHSRDCTSSMG
eukprot:scaffold433_cov260-Chaetoceros_neogracile.AAC.10